MAQEKIIISQNGDGEWTARVYDGKMLVFIKQHNQTKNAAQAAVKQFQKEQQEMIESGELLLLED